VIPLALTAVTSLLLEPHTLVLVEHEGRAGNTSVPLEPVVGGPPADQFVDVDHMESADVAPLQVHDVEQSARADGAATASAMKAADTTATTIGIANGLAKPRVNANLANPTRELPASGRQPTRPELTDRRRQSGASA
jgi:hypothetical protein